MDLTKAEQKLEEWQTATGCLIGAAEGRDFLMHARIGVMQALNRNAVREFNPDRKDTKGLSTHPNLAPFLYRLAKSDAQIRTPFRGKLLTRGA
jgi:hypothetical protein